MPIPEHRIWGGRIFTERIRLWWPNLKSTTCRPIHSLSIMANIRKGKIKWEKPCDSSFSFVERKRQYFSTFFERKLWTEKISTAQNHGRRVHPFDLEFSSDLALVFLHQSTITRFFFKIPLDVFIRYFRLVLPNVFTVLFFCLEHILMSESFRPKPDRKCHDKFTRSRSSSTLPAARTPHRSKLRRTRRTPSSRSVSYKFPADFVASRTLGHLFADFRCDPSWSHLVWLSLRPFRWKRLDVFGQVLNLTSVGLPLKKCLRYGTAFSTVFIIWFIFADFG